MSINRENTGLIVVALLFGLLAASPSVQSAQEGHWWGETVDSRLAEAGTNRVEMAKALNEVSTQRREGITFLLENMPAADMRSLSAAFLVEEVNLAYDAFCFGLNRTNP